jgi:RHS repeat-associated protein
VTNSSGVGTPDWQVEFSYQSNNQAFVSAFSNSVGDYSASVPANQAIKICVKLKSGWGYGNPGTGCHFEQLSAGTTATRNFSVNQSGALVPSAAKVLSAPARQVGTPSEVVTYYDFGGRRVAMRKRATRTSTTDPVVWLHGDHLGSASMATGVNNYVSGKVRYRPFGEPQTGDPAAFPTQRLFTGQMREDEGAVGSLYFYNARFYSPYSAHFISADTIVPGAGNPQAFNRYSYGFSNPLSVQIPAGIHPKRS